MSGGTCYSQSRRSVLRKFEDSLKIEFDNWMTIRILHLLLGSTSFECCLQWEGALRVTIGALLAITTIRMFNEFQFRDNEIQLRYDF